jgi:dynein heavy chain 2
LKKEEAKVLGTKEEVQMTLTKVQPIVDAAMKQVQSISRKDINEMKSYAQPPPAIKDVFTALFKFMGIADSSWNSIKKMLANASFLESMIDIDARTLPRATREEISKFIKKNPGSFETASIFRVSQAAGPIAEYIKAIISLAETLEKIAPLEAKLEAVDSSLRDKKETLKKCEQGLQRIDEQVEGLKQTFALKTGEAERLKSELKFAENRLEKATLLLSKLGEEEIRWEKSLKVIMAEILS